MEIDRRCVRALADRAVRVRSSFSTADACSLGPHLPAVRTLRLLSLLLTSYSLSHGPHRLFPVLAASTIHIMSAWYSSCFLKRLHISSSCLIRICSQTVTQFSKALLKGFQIQNNPVAGGRRDPRAQILVECYGWTQFSARVRSLQLATVQII